MKKRSGFVSNSSSSSFVLQAGPYTVFDYALEMLQVQNEYNNDLECKEECDEELKTMDVLRIALQFRKIDYDTSIAFRSCNYDTYITKRGDKVVVNTCNNVPWESHSNVLQQCITDTVSDDMDYDIHNDALFFWPEFDSYGCMKFGKCPKCGCCCDVFVPLGDKPVYLCCFDKKSDSKTEYCVQIAFKDGYNFNETYVNEFKNFVSGVISVVNMGEHVSSISIVKDDA